MTTAVSGRCAAAAAVRRDSHSELLLPPPLTLLLPPPLPLLLLLVVAVEQVRQVLGVVASRLSGRPPSSSACVQAAWICSTPNAGWTTGYAVRSANGATSRRHNTSDGGLAARL